MASTQSEIPTTSDTKDIEDKEDTEPTILHNLQNKWTLWFEPPAQRGSWDPDNMKSVYTFDTIEDFWRLFNNILPASRLTPGSNYSLFKAGIKPTWEDSANTDGGSWLVILPRSNSNNKDFSIVDTMFLNLIISIIGENIIDNETINGVVLSVRRQCKLSLWTKDASDNISCMNIGTRLKSILELPEDVKIVYDSHKNALARSKQPKYTI